MLRYLKGKKIKIKKCIFRIIMNIESEKKKFKITFFLKEKNWMYKQKKVI